MRAGPRPRGWIEIAVVVGATTLGLLAARPPSIDLPWGLEAWLIPAVFLYVPLIAVIVSGHDFKSIGFETPRIGRGAVDLAGLAGVILPLFLLGWWALMSFGFGARFAVRAPRAPWASLLHQLIAVALPEEVFFRGWLQGRLNQILDRRFHLFGASFGPGLVLSALAFAAAHYLVRPAPLSLLVFFPGLLFGYLRESSASLAVPILAHAACNFSFLILQSWAEFP